MPITELTSYIVVLNCYLLHSLKNVCIFNTLPYVCLLTCYNLHCLHVHTYLVEFMYNICVLKPQDDDARDEVSVLEPYIIEVNYNIFLL